MLNIVIIGAGDVGSYIASVLSKEQHNIILIDKNGITLERVSSQPRCWHTYRIGNRLAAIR